MSDRSSLRIALFTGNYNHIEDGVSRTLGRLVGYLLAQGHAVVVVGPTIEKPLDQPGAFLAAPSVPIPGRAEYRLTTGFPRDLRQRVAAFQPDIVHLATPDVLGHRALAWAQDRGLPVVTTYHTHFTSYLDYYKLGFVEPAMWAIARRFYNRCDEVYVPTSTMQSELTAHGVTSTIRQWPRGIELDRFAPSRRSEAWRRQNGFGPDEVVVTFISRLVREKGLDVYASVVQRLRDEGAPVRSLIVGDGPERDALRDKLPTAVFAGHLGGDDLAVAYASSDIFLFPSETETFGNVTLEAMASGLAVVVADAAGSKSLVDEGRTGLLCPARDLAAFTEATRSLVHGPDLRRSLGSRARTEARQYDWSAVLAGMETNYRDVLDSRG